MRRAVALILSFFVLASVLTASVASPAPKKLEVIMVFHINQAVVPYGNVANDACYSLLLKTLRKHASSKFVIHISGTLLVDLQWFNNSVIRMVQDGVREGQFEVLGSTFSQNVLYSSNPLDNDAQIKKHKELIEALFDVEPKGFWNPERTWNQTFVELLAENGYEYTLIEDRVLRDSNVTTPEWLVRTTSYHGRTLTLFNDDKEMIQVVDSVALTNADPQVVVDYLQYIYEQDVNDEFVVVYAQDGEAWGLWEWEHGTDPKVIAERLDRLLNTLESLDWVELTTFEDYLSEHVPSEHVPQLCDGQAAWMVDAARELGWNDWFDFNENSTALNAVRKLFDEVRAYLLRVESEVQLAALEGKNVTAAEKLLKHAWTVFLASQYEFGVIADESWYLMRNLYNRSKVALVAAYAALKSLNASYEVEEFDVNNDTLVELVVSTPKDLVVLSPIGGRVLYWFNLETGEDIISNEIPVRYGEPSTQLDSYVPPLVYMVGHNYPYRRRAFADTLVLGVRKYSLYGMSMNYTWSSNGSATVVSFRCALPGGEGVFVKNVTVLENQLRADYALALASFAGRAKLYSEVEVNPDDETVLLGGGQCFVFRNETELKAFSYGESVYGVVRSASVANALSGATLKILPSTPSSVLVEPHFLSLSLRFEHVSEDASSFNYSLLLMYEKHAVNVTALLSTKTRPSLPEYDDDVLVLAKLPSFFRRATLLYSAEGNHSAPMSYYSGSYVSALIPARKFLTAVSYAVEAETVYGERYVGGSGSYVVGDYTPPALANFAVVTSRETAGFKLLVNVTVLEPENASGLQYVLLNYSTNRERWFQLQMKSSGNGTFYAEVELVFAREVLFTVVAVDNAGNKAVFPLNGRPYFVRLVPEYEVTASILLVQMATVAALALVIASTRLLSKRAEVTKRT